MEVVGKALELLLLLAVMGYTAIAGSLLKRIDFERLIEAHVFYKKELEDIRGVISFCFLIGLVLIFYITFSLFT